ncbi:hypothetical protein [Sulfitobacter sp. HGT1]|uniref:hypothetical protein n=1 Tax=Sulfitobacter sp. HGT1 TaxID=2735435 RepID=UPI00159313C5|nr:hypothetical protein [Sulfitobacter sp. HGT1]
MTDTDFSTNIHVLKPRTVSVSEKLDQFLEEHRLTPAIAMSKPRRSRPIASNINAMSCDECGDVEYLTRDFCRCGHYLRGQLEDEYIEWEKEIQADHIELSDSVSRKLKPVRYIVLVSILFLVVPLLYLSLWPEHFTLKSFLWLIPGVVIGGGSAFVEKHMDKPVQESEKFLQNHTFETFIEQRFFRQLKAVSELSIEAQNGSIR